MVSPVALRYYPLPFRAVSAIPPLLIQDQRPDFVVGIDALVPDQLLDAVWFSRDYRLRATFPLDHPVWGVARARDNGTAILVYERVRPQCCIPQ
jgi:hypothetical protein